jgi:hypothetical protein
VWRGDDVCARDLRRDLLDVEEQWTLVLPISCSPTLSLAFRPLLNDGASPPGSDGRTALHLTFFLMLPFS